ncbi:MAG: phenylalanine--tRNA ligase subunit beta [Verrucomicrobiota bacterium]|nr:phenylalanine--tRNA ligase subunit beta [Verrucomicrobiota bacterium]
MKFSLNWLREFVELPASTEDLSQLLTLAGVEIEGVETRGADFENVVVAEINTSAQHPNADRLSVCEVDDGSGTKRQIVCGAKNYKVGDKVPLALPGATLPGDFKIKASKLRGVESQGMLCSGKELGLSDETAGLLILSPDAEVGAPIGSLFPPDTILDVEITPNRGDLLSHFGMAREIAALTGKSLRALPAPNATRETSAIGVRITARHECAFYSVRRIENVNVGPSPQWLRAKLEAVGLRSINNIVDITNFVMLELGQPLHAFDLDTLSGSIEVRLAAEGENFLALDGRNYSLGQENLVITDEQRAVAIAGVMGGEQTGVPEKTRRVLLESAYFLPTSVRRTARKLNLPSDSSYRFERGVDPAMILRASARATQLIRELAGGEPAAEIETAGTLPTEEPKVPLRFARCDQLLGVAIPRSVSAKILAGFGLSEVEADEEKAVWKIPSYRGDLRREVDLIEEIVRASGIDQIAGANRSRFTPVSGADRNYDRESRMRQLLAAQGVSEVRTSALLPRGTSLFRTAAMELRNPLSEDHVALRPSLIPGLLAVLARNVRAGEHSIRLFEIGRTFAAENGAESRHLALLLYGNGASKSQWRGGAVRLLDLFDAKGVLEALSSDGVSFRRSARNDLALAADIFRGDEAIGFIGQLRASDAAAIGATAPVIIAEISLRTLIESAPRATSFSELDKFPAVGRDIAMIVAENLSHEEIERTIRGANEPLLAAVSLFDLFGGKAAETLGAGRKSLAYTLTYRDKNRTLTNDEINVVHARIRERLQRELAVELRE